VETFTTYSLPILDSPSVTIASIRAPALDFLLVESDFVKRILEMKASFGGLLGLIPSSGFWWLLPSILDLSLNLVFVAIAFPPFLVIRTLDSEGEFSNNIRIRFHLETSNYSILRIVIPIENSQWI
jgi:hypothetical protein